MAEAETPHVQDNPEVRHEKSDIYVNPVMLFGAGLLVLSVLVFAGVYWLMGSYESRVMRRPPALAAPEGEAEPADFPRLQVSPAADLNALRAAEAQALGTYGWVDRDKEIVRLPIARAMELIAKKGLPTRQKAGPDSAAGDGAPNKPK